MTKHINSLNMGILKVLENELRYVDKNNIAVIEWLSMRIAEIKGE